MMKTQTFSEFVNKTFLQVYDQIFQIYNGGKVLKLARVFFFDYDQKIFSSVFS